jgi:hypothetical protein
MSSKSESNARKMVTPLPFTPDMDKTPPPFFSKFRKLTPDAQRESDPDGILPPLISCPERERSSEGKKPGQ